MGRDAWALRDRLGNTKKTAEQLRESTQTVGQLAGLVDRRSELRADGREGDGRGLSMS